MALGTIGSALASGAIKAGIGFGASKLFGGKNRGGTASFAPSGFSGGGLTGSFNQGTGQTSVRSNEQRQGFVGNLASLFPQQAGLVSGIRSQLAPGFGALTQSRLAELDTRRRESVGNLRDNLQRRRVLGSSFGADAVSRADAEFAQDADRIRAESFLQELDLNRQLIQEEFNLRRNEFQTQLDELNLQAELASGLVKGATAQLGANARLKEQLNTKEATGFGSFFGQTFGPFANAVGSRLGGGGIGDFTTVTRDAAGNIL